MGDPEIKREQIKNDVIEIMSETLEISPDVIEDTLKDGTGLPFDSLQLYEFVIDIEEKYDIQLPDELLDEIKSVEDMVDVIVRLTEKS